ncbi:helicase superfamily 1/2 ATP-binding domain protein [Vibrio phage 1.031.O._10N.261.46.F8]|nr:helicase superfamily 1/2 ATP-binding domain protein [Vibrio phage 1.031.O._10N.261.46.F8]
MLNHFPYPSARENQATAIQHVEDKLVNSDTKVCILELPTGIGKSAIAYTIAKYYESKEQRCRVITKTKNLQKQYIEEFPTMATVSGKGNYKDDEEYLKVMSSFNDSSIGVTNYSNLENCMWQGDDVLIIDESHEYLEHIHDQMHYKFKSGTTDKSLCRIIELCKNFSSLRVRSIVKNFNFAYRTMVEYALNESSPVKYDFALANFAKLVKLLNSINPEIKVMIHSSEFGIEIFVNGVKEYFEDIVSGYDKVILMSANFGGLEFFKDVMGLYAHKEIGNCPEPEMDWIYTGEGCYQLGTECTEHSIHQSPFAAEQRPIRYIRNYTLGHHDKEARLKIIVEENIDPIIEYELEHGAPRGVIHSVSYETAHMIVGMSKYASIMRVVKTALQLESALADETVKVILSPALEAGVSLDGDKATFQIVAKAPIEPNMGINKFLVRAHGQKYMTRKSVMRVVQMSGRIIRTDECRGTTYIVDKNYGRVAGCTSWQFYPDYFWDNFKTSHNFQDSVANKFL